LDLLLRLGTSRNTTRGVTMPGPNWQTGVYYWVNQVNGKIYVGGAYSSFYARHATHLSGLRNNRHRNKHLQASWNKYGEENFLFVIMEKCHPTKVQEREQHHIDKFWETERDTLYNLSPTAGSTLGMEQSDETRAKVSAAVQKRAGDIA